MRKPPGRAQGHRNRAGRAAARRALTLEPGCVICGGRGAPVCSRRCEGKLSELGGPAKAAAVAEDEASRSATLGEAAAWRDLAARLRAIA